MRKKTIQVLLTEDVYNLGRKGTLIKVKPGYLRNYLIPLKLAKIPTISLINQLQVQQKSFELKQLAFSKECMEIKNLIESFGKFTIRKKVSENGVFYGKITKRQIFDLISSKINSSSFDLNKNQIQLPEIKQLGEYVVQIIVAPNIIASINIEVLPE